MKIRTDDFRVREGDDIKLHKLATITEPIYGSTKDYQELLAKHVLQLSELQGKRGFSPTFSAGH